MTLKLAGRLPEKEYDGLSALADDFMADPAHTVVALVRFERVGYRHDDETGDDIPTVVPAQIEPLNGDDLGVDIAALFADRAEGRRMPGSRPLDDGTDELAALMGELDALATDLDVEPTALTAEYAEQHGNPPLGDPNNLANLRQFLFERRQQVPVRGIDEVPLPEPDEPDAES